MCLFSVFYTSVLQRGKKGAMPAWQGPEGRALRWGTGNPASLSCLSLSHCVALGHVTSLSAPAPLCHGVVPPNRALSACLLVFVLVKCLGGVFGDALPGRGRHRPVAHGGPRQSTVLRPQSSRSHAQRGRAGGERGGGPITLPWWLSCLPFETLSSADSAPSALHTRAGTQTAL